MRSKNKQDGQSKPTFIEMARRTQIIEHAVNTIADLGYSQASLAHIAARAGISKGVISYHFADKYELMEEIVRAVLSDFADFVRPRMDLETTVAGQLRVFIEANMAFIHTHRNQLLAALDIIANARTEDGDSLVDINLVEADLVGLEALLIQGQQQGEFREFNHRVMAVSIISLRNGVIDQLARHPDLDLNVYAREIVTLIDLATRETE
jgi:AcrR family transcriptional regulator